MSREYIGRSYIGSKIIQVKQSKPDVNKIQVYLDCEGTKNYKLGYDLDMKEIIYSMEINYNDEIEKIDIINGIKIDYNGKKRRLNIIGSLNFEEELTYFLDYLHSVIKDIEDDKLIIENIKESIIKWKTFIEMPASNVRKLDESVEVGLYGELLTLDTLIDMEGEEVLDSWKGPDYAPKDFDMSIMQIETKTILNDKESIRIHGIEQLEIEKNKDLFVHVHDLSRDDEDGKTLHDIIYSIDKKIKKMENKKEFHSKLGDAKYRPNQECRKFILNKSQFYKVDENFNRLDNKKINMDGINKVEYSIELNKIKKCKVSSYR